MDNLKGINTDVNPRNQIPGSYRFALNAVNNSKDGDMRSLSNEQGNIQDVLIPDGFLPIGSCYLRPNESIIVSTDDTYVRIDKRVNKMLVNLFYIKNSGWTSVNQVKIEHKVVKGCEDILIITDGVNSIRYINITERDEYLLDGETIDTANADGEGWNLGQMNINPSFTIPTVSSVEVLDTGGSLDLGAYIIVPQYLTQSLDATSWLQHIGVIPVYDEAFYGEYTSIDGGITLETTKSIRIQFSNLDRSFTYLRLAVIQNIDGVVSANIIATLPINGSTLSYIITGNEVGTSIDLADITTENGVYESAEDIKLYDNRLWLLNVKERQIDHAVLQQAAFDIKASWFSDYVQAEFSGSEDTKSAVYYLDHRSHMRDEVYAYGIRFKFTGNWYTPVYPLAGRQKDTGFYTTLPTSSEPNVWHNRPAPTTGWDSTLYTVGVDIQLADVEHLGFITGSEDIGDGPGLVQRWKVFNTATVDSSLFGDHLSAGEFAYIESTDLYPDHEVYGDNAGLPIRDFKFPDAILHDIGRGVMGGSTTSVFSTDNIANGYAVFPIGVKFTNINIPDIYSNEIEGYEIVRIERTEANSTVLDKGILHRVAISEGTGATIEDYLQQTFPANWIDDTTSADYHRYIDQKYQTFHSPVVKFNGFIGGSYLKIDGEQSGFCLSYPGLSSFYRLMLTPRGFGYDTLPDFTETLHNRKINDKSFAGADTPPTSGLSVDVDNTEQQEALYLELNQQLQFSKSFEMFPTPLTDVSYFLYAAIKENLLNQYGQVEGRVYISTDSILHEDSECEIFAGDTFISPLTFRRCVRWDEDYAVINHNEEGDVSTYEGKELFKFYTESKINTNLRHEGADAAEIYYPKSNYTSITDFIYQEAAPDTDLIPNYYAYNDVFSWEKNIKAFFGIPFGFNYDSDCIGEFPTRIVCSEKDNIESSSDSNKIFLPNNYRDLSKTRGDGLSLFIKGDKLFAHMERTLFNIPVKDVTTKIGDINAYFGTGEVLSIPPQEVVTAEKGQVGLSSKWSHVETPYGVVFVSHEDKKIYLFSESLEPISSLGLSTWSNENMKFHLIDDIVDLMNSETEEEQFTRFRNNASPYGIGFHSTYDSKHDRVLITKRDYRIKFTTIREGGLFLGLYDSDTEYDEGYILYDPITQTFGIIEYGDGPGTGQTFKPLNYYDADYFEDCSWTLSFSFLSKSWVSYHSYIPLFYMFDKDMFYSYFWNMTKIVITGLGGHPHIAYIQSDISNYLYSHSIEADFQTYYTDLKDHIIDLIIPAQTPSNFTNILVDSKLSNLDSTYNEWHDINFIPFTKFIAYNTDQCTGEHSIVTLNDYNNTQQWTSNISYARRIGNLWRIDNLRNLVVDNTISMFTSRYEDISPSYYIDKVLNTPAINYNLSQYKMGRMNDFWLGLRLTSIFEEGDTDYNPGKLKVTTNIINTINYQSR